MIPPGWQFLEIAAPRFAHGDPRNLPIEMLDMSIRPFNCLNGRWHGVQFRTLGDVCENSRGDLLRVKNFGKGCLMEVERALSLYGLALRQERDS